MPDSIVSSEQAVQRDTSNTVPEIATVASTGRGQAFRGLKRQLTEEDLGSPGAQKLVLEMLAAAEADCADYKSYVVKYYEAHESAAVLSVQLQSDRLNETMFNVGIAVGAAIVGLSPFFWNDAKSYGLTCLVVGGILIVGFTAARIFFVRKK